MSSAETTDSISVADTSMHADTPYVLGHDDLERQRLYTQYSAFKEYLGGIDAGAPLHELDPKAILEVGSGTCLW
jgi:hypothetical protein